MLPLGALAVAVLLNGAQILLPAPAFVEQGRTWAPARAIFARLGDKVRWDPAQQVMTIQLPGHMAVFPLDAPPTLDGRPLRTELAARRVEGTIYVPLMALRDLGLKVHWDDQARQVVLSAQLLGRAPSLAAILSDPPAWNGQEVTLTGEYLGWTPDRFSFATRSGPPVSSGDWVLRNADGSIYCSPGPVVTAQPTAASLASLASPLPALTPYAALGQRFAVTGTIRLTAQAIPYLQFTGVKRPEGRAGLTCRLVLERLQCQPGQRVEYELQLANPQAARVALTLPEVITVSVLSPDGRIFVSNQSCKPQTSGVSGLEAGGELQIRGAWAIPEEAGSGDYLIVARVSDEVGTYGQCFTVQVPEKASRHAPVGD